MSSLLDGRGRWGLLHVISNPDSYRANATIKKNRAANSTATGIVEVLPSEAVTPGSYDCHQTQFALHESRAVAAASNVDPELSSNDIAIFGASRLNEAHSTESHGRDERKYC